MPPTRTRTGEAGLVAEPPGPSGALVAEPAELARVVQAIEAAGRFALDLEFVSEDRYVPDLALVQVAFGDADHPTIAAIDPLEVDVSPLVALVGRPDVEVVAHAARQDLGLLAARFGVTARGLFDTQLACSLVGLPDQMGYGRMVAELFGVQLDKGSQFTAWARRPLSDKQLRYALDDVRYLLSAGRELDGRLAALGRQGWLREEGERLAEVSAARRVPEDMWRTIGGAAGLRGPGLGVLAALAAWREREALASNTPPSWLASDAALTDLARRPPRTLPDLARFRALPPATIERHGDALLVAIGAGTQVPKVAPPAGRTLGVRGQAWAPIVIALIHAVAGELGVPPRLVGARADAEELVAWFEAGADGEERVALLRGWRRAVAGEPLVAFLRGERSVTADPLAPGGLRFAPR